MDLSNPLKVFHDFDAPSRMVALAMPKVKEKTKSGIVKTPDQKKQEQSSNISEGAVIISVGKLAKEAGIEEHMRAYTSFQARPEYIIERAGFRMLLFDYQRIVLLRDPEANTSFLPEIEDTGEHTMIQAP